MLLNYLTIIFRNIIKRKFLSILNALCIIIGLTTFLLSLNYILYEMSYDDFHEKKDQIYRIYCSVYDKSRTEVQHEIAVITIEVGPELKEKYPEVLESVLLFQLGASWKRPIISYKDHNYVETRACYASPSFFKVFMYKFFKENHPL